MKEWNDIEKLIVEDSKKMGMDFQDEFWDEMESILDENEKVAPITMIVEDDYLQPSNEGPFQEAYWDEMSLILDKEDKKKRRLLLFRWSFDIAAILLLMLTVIQPNTPSIYTDVREEFTATKKSHHNATSTPTSSEEESEVTDPSEIIQPQEPQNNTTLQSDQFTPSVQISSINTDGARIINHYDPIENLEISEIASVSDPSGISKSLKKGMVTSTEALLSSSFREKDIFSASEQLVLREDIGSLETNVPRVINLYNPTIVYNGNNSTNSSDRLKRIRIRPMSINLVAGSSIALAPEGNVDNKSRIGSNTTFTFEALKHSVNWSYSFGVNVAHRTGINHELLLTKANYGVRLYRDYQSVTYKSISSIGIPVGVNYHLRRNVFGLRVAASWNVLVNSTYHRYNNYNSDELLVKNNIGIKEGINPFDVRLSLMYQRRLSERLALGINFSTGFFNQIDENYIPDTKGLYEYSLGLNVNYTIFNF